MKFFLPVVFLVSLSAFGQNKAASNHTGGQGGGAGFAPGSENTGGNGGGAGLAPVRNKDHSGNGEEGDISPPTADELNAFLETSRRTNAGRSPAVNEEERGFPRKEFQLPHSHTVKPESIAIEQ